MCRRQHCQRTRWTSSGWQTARPSSGHPALRITSLRPHQIRQRVTAAVVASRIPSLCRRRRLIRGFTASPSSCDSSTSADIVWPPFSRLGRISSRGWIPFRWTHCECSLSVCLFVCFVCHVLVDESSVCSHHAWFVRVTARSLYTDSVDILLSALLHLHRVPPKISAYAEVLHLL